MSARKLATYQEMRDFGRTPEPEGAARAKSPGGPLAFVIQKHAASHLHYDLRLEAEGVMKSWAVPKGPSLDPSVKRLAMEVEDHPMEYNEFEGTIPKGQYGGGTVMLWDRGSYEPDDAKPGEKADRTVLRGLRAGKLSFTMHGERLRGSFALVRTRRGEDTGKPQWLFFKHTDDFADPDVEITDEMTTSVATGRTMDEISAGKGDRSVWQSNRGGPSDSTSRSAEAAVPRPDTSKLSPMLCETGSAVPQGADWVFEPKYDGIRVLAWVTQSDVSLVTRNGNDKREQFPDLAEALRDLSRRVDRPLVLDGEIVAIDEQGNHLRFQAIQGRMHVRNRSRVRQHTRESPVVFVAFDILMDGSEVVAHEPLEERRARLDALGGETQEPIRLAEVAQESEEMLRRAHRAGWEGIIAKRRGSVYRPGRRSGDWLKLKIRYQQEFVVVGWTEPRRSREYFGSLLLGYYDPEGRLVYAGHTGTGFTRERLKEVHAMLSRLERKTPPLDDKPPKTNERAHWVTPKLVVEVQFNDWTRDGLVFQASFLGLRTDKEAKEVVREPRSLEEPVKPAKKSGAAPGKKPPRAKAKSISGKGSLLTEGELHTPIAARLREIATSGDAGVLRLDTRTKLSVTSLSKVFFPKTRITKGDLLAYYAEMAEPILPWMKDRPLVLKRFPNGIDGESFYQQAAPDEAPAAVRVETIENEENEEQKRLVGGNLATLLYTIQLGAISYDPWHSRVQSLAYADYTVLDLDPGPGANFRRVIEVASFVKEEMDRLEIHGALKTSGSSGLHIYLPLPPKTPLEAATLIAQIIATRVAARHPKIATVERMTRRRPHGTIYVDYLQNILGKTVAGVYAARAKPGATVSTPLQWHELTPDLDMRDFTILTVPARVREMGDPWAAAMARPIKLDALRP